MKDLKKIIDTMIKKHNSAVVLDRDQKDRMLRNAEEKRGTLKTRRP